MCCWSAFVGIRIERGAASHVLVYHRRRGPGLPFFAGGASGGHVLIGATAGYLVGFVIAAYVIGLLAERGLRKKRPHLRSFRFSLAC